jgi:RimJ/RimL family protein N-acetyltransferase
VRLETERLLLRPLAIVDIDDLVALGEDPEVSRFVDQLGRAAAEERVRSTEREWRQRGSGMFAVVDRGKGGFLGRVGLRYWPQFEETEIGWVLRRDAWGKGYATEAARACLDWAFAKLDLPYITSMIHPENTASLQVAHRLGMSELRRDVLEEERVIVFSTNRDEFESVA